MALITQKEKANQFRQLHSAPDMLVLPNAWDAASACILEQAGFQAIATTSSGVAASLGYPDGQHISRDMLLGVVENITRVVACPVSIDIEAGFGESIEEVVKIVEAIIRAGAVGINIEDTTKQGQPSLVDIAYQVELLKAIQEAAASMDVPLVINARTDVYLLPGDEAASRFERAVERANAYLQAGADCAFPIGVSDAPTIARLVKAIAGPINIIAGPPAPALTELAQLGVARVTFASGLMRATLGHLQHIARELLANGTYTNMGEHLLSGRDFRSLFEAR
ncbi:MAG: isocitrate lyase/PEP mutase family protein [Ktedonobacteraceae bacterium]